MKTDEVEGKREHKPKQSILSKMSFLTFAHVIASGFGFLAMWLVEHHYGDAELGRYLIALQCVTQALLITRFGTDQYAVRQVAAGNELPGSVAATVIRLRSLWAVGGFALLLGFAFIGYQEERTLIAIMSLCMLPTIVRVEWISQALHRSNVYGAWQLGLQVLNLSLVGLAVLLSLKLWAVAWARVLTEVLVALVLLRWTLKHLTRIDWKARAQSVAAMTRASAPIAAT